MQSVDVVDVEMNEHRWICVEPLRALETLTSLTDHYHPALAQHQLPMRPPGGARLCQALFRALGAEKAEARTTRKKRAPSGRRWPDSQLAKPSHVDAATCRAAAARRFGVLTILTRF